MSDDPNADGAQVVILPPVLFALQIVVAEILYLVRPLGFGSSAGLRAAVGFLLLAAGVALMSSAFNLFKGMGQNPNPRTPTPAITRDGAYGFTRNPMYVAGALMLLGIGCARGNAWIILSMIPGFLVMHYGVILREEPYLERTFGDAYREYKRAVRRWL